MIKSVFNTTTDKSPVFKFFQNQIQKLLSKITKNSKNSKTKNSSNNQKP